MYCLIGILLALCCPLTAAAEEVLEISVKGISDGQRDGAQKDRMEAVMDAKRQACEKAGVRIASETRVENFKLAFDLVESQAEALLLPGFQVIDVGYVEDGTYNVVLVGKLRVLGADTGESAKFTLIINLHEKEPFAGRTQAVDKLYEWLDIAHGVFSINGKSLEAYEDNIESITRTDSLFSYDTRVYAFTYRLPPGKLTYTQRTPTQGGGTSNHDFKLKLRSGLQYLMYADHPNALYFNRPREFDGTSEKTRLYNNYPDEFKPAFE